MSVLDGPGEGSWSVFALKVVEERDLAREERDGALAYIEHLRSELDDILQQRNEALRAIRQVLLSRDSAWKGGHDWQDAVDEAANVYRKFGPKGI